MVVPPPPLTETFKVLPANLSIFRMGDNTNKNKKCNPNQKKNDSYAIFEAKNVDVSKS